MFTTVETPNSSNIERIGYSADALTVRVAFKRKDGIALWEYWPVTEEDYIAIRDAESVGKAVHQYLVKGPYQSKRVTE